MKIKYVKLLSSTLTIGVFLFLAFGSGENSKTEESNTEVESSAEPIDNSSSAGNSYCSKHGKMYRTGESCSECQTEETGSQNEKEDDGLEEFRRRASHL
jgi:hypothetical protein